MCHILYIITWRSMVHLYVVPRPVLHDMYACTCTTCMHNKNYNMCTTVCILHVHTCTMHRTCTTTCTCRSCPFGIHVKSIFSYPV